MEEVRMFVAAAAGAGKWQQETRPYVNGAQEDRSLDQLHHKSTLRRKITFKHHQTRKN